MLGKNKNILCHLVVFCFFSLNSPLTSSSSSASFEEIPQDLKKEIIYYLSIPDIAKLVLTSQALHRAFFLEYDSYGLPSHSTLKYCPKNYSIREISGLYKDLSSGDFVESIHQIFQPYQESIENWEEASQNFVMSYFGFEDGAVSTIDNDRAFINSLAVLECAIENMEPIEDNIHTPVNQILLWIEGGIKTYLNVLEEINNFEGIHLVLDDRSLRFVPPEIGSLVGLKSLLLADNFLSFLPAKIENLASLETLWLNNNYLFLLPPEIGQLSKLKKLRIQSNKFQQYPEILHEMQIENLNIQDNPFNS